MSVRLTKAKFIVCSKADAEVVSSDRQRHRRIQVILAFFIKQCFKIAEGDSGVMGSNVPDNQQSNNLCRFVDFIARPARAKQVSV